MFDAKPFVFAFDTNFAEHTLFQNLVTLTETEFIKTALLVLTSVLASSNGWTIDCQYSTQQYGIPQLSSAYQCQGTFTDDGSPTITQVTGTLDPGKTLADVQVFYLMSNGYGVRTYMIPSNFGSTFPGLRGIIWSNSKLEVLKASDLQAFPNLVIATFSFNFLRHIDGDLFKNNPNLQSIDLSGNFIDYIGAGLFNGLTQLQNVMLYSNICIGYMGQMIQPIGNGYTVADMQEDIDHLCGPFDPSGGSSSSGVCSANCTARFDALEAEVSVIEASLTAPWYEKLKWFFRTAFGLF